MRTRIAPKIQPGKCNSCSMVLPALHQNKCDGCFRQALIEQNEKAMLAHERLGNEHMVRQFAEEIAEIMRGDE